MKQNTLYLECYSGISGDMVVATLLDLGADEQVLLNGLASCNMSGYSLNIYKTKKCGIVAKKFDVCLTSDIENHKHNEMKLHLNRNINDIYDIILKSNITANAKELAKKIFDVVAIAESKVHGKSIEEVHFHEVGAIDSIVDIIATAICLDNLNIGSVIISSLYEGTGHVKCQHGIIPVPVPAVVEIVNRHDLEIKITETIGEMVTPTGAAIAASIKTTNKLPDNYKIRKIGIGAGTKDFLKANILRGFFIDEIIKKNNEETITILECNVDDITGEELGFALEILLEQGALDAYFTPIYMKKNRPSYMFSVICNNDDCELMKKLIFKHTSTLGIRVHNYRRYIMNRRLEDFNSSLGQVRIKIGTYKDIIKRTIEYEDAKNIAKTNNMSVGNVLKTIYSELNHIIKL
ncbi:nickel pincer cofactor biosynthesis protein LarC [Alkalibaculum sp. M08DMB]|uniref:Pyridinium-3,5-bisthiocarboxylic acid mononucleotide nickel insertion protein n=1 Tax=Alkalibaculum sporogenes TaxID=2655001 RepID=A0A6A7K980_9FIRM|nr:nickel pincer cofactor biosynthesis protein LarC [Alkalibaculum sporogenes]MPW26069.1 nickel pincer cofactor biosynthesis protein LarC [Alkalibaculum sporogenes]